MFKTLIEALNIPDKHIHKKLDSSELKDLVDRIQKDINEDYFGELHIAPRICIIFEDFIGNRDFMKSAPFIDCFVANRHSSISTIACTQSFTRVPRACRLQAHALLYFEGSQSELDIISEEFGPPGVRWQDFQKFVSSVVAQPYQFMYINTQVPPDIRYRHNFSKILDISRLPRTGGDDRVNYDDLHTSQDHEREQESEYEQEQDLDYSYRTSSDERD